MKNKVRLLVIVALIASVAFFIWRQEAPESPQTASTLNDEKIAFDREKHQQYVELLMEERGFTKEHALEEALKVQVEHLALLEKVKILRIEISEEEARKEVLKTRQAIEENDDETKLAIEKTIKNLGMTEEEYWNDYVVNGYKEMLAIEQLKTFAANEEKHWQDFFRDIVAEFEQTYDKEIIAFRREVEK